MATPLTLPPLPDSQVTELQQLYHTTTEANLRLRYQIVLLAHQRRSVAEIAAMVFRSRETVERLLKRCLRGGTPALPRRQAPGVTPPVPPAWQAELLRVLALDPHTVGIRRANWPTGLFATSLATTTSITVTAETVRLYLHAAGDVCKRPTWPLTRQAEAQPGSVGNG